MNNNESNRFITNILRGKELKFLYKDREFVIQGQILNNKIKTLYLYEKKNAKNKCIWNASGSEVAYPIKEFLENKIFDDKNFFEIANEIIWNSK